MALESDSIAHPPSLEVDSYRLIETLTADRTFLCSDASANVVVLVKLEEDCLHRGQLHPSIRDRLARVRDLPHPRVATLRGVERWNGLACMVWVYLDGETWEDHIRQHPAQFPALAAGLTATIGTLHDTGIVHGNLHGKNIIVRPDRQAWFTQVSPYLYADPTVDVGALTQLLRRGGEHLATATAHRLHRLLGEFESQKIELKELSQSLLELDRDETVEEPEGLPVKETGYRRRSLIGAVAIAVAAITAGLVIRWSFTRHAAPGPATFPSLKQEGRS